MALAEQANSILSKTGVYSEAVELTEAIGEWQSRQPRSQSSGRLVATALLGMAATAALCHLWTVGWPITATLGITFVGFYALPMSMGYQALGGGMEAALTAQCMTAKEKESHAQAFLLTSWALVLLSVALYLVARFV